MPEIRLRVQENGASAGLTVEQARVIEAISPTIDVERVEGGAQITVEDYRGVPQSVVVQDGAVGEWVQPESTNAYMRGDKVTHGGQTWVSTCDNNVWEPGVYGWEVSA